MIKGTPVPKTWATLDEFTEWYKRNGYPIRVPENARVIPIDGSYTCCVFRQDVYQVEIYLAAGNFTSPRHSHPFEQKIIFMGGHLVGARGDREEDGSLGEEQSRGMLGSPITPESSPTLPHPHAGYAGLAIAAGQWHEIDGLGEDQGFIFFNCQKWPNKEMMSSAVIEYEGEPCGDVHDKVIKRIN